MTVSSRLRRCSRVALGIALAASLSGCVEEVGSISPSVKDTHIVTRAQREAEYQQIKREVMADEKAAPSVSKERKSFQQKVKKILKPKRQKKKRKTHRKKARKHPARRSKKMAIRKQVATVSHSHHIPTEIIKYY